LTEPVWVVSDGNIVPENGDVAIHINLRRNPNSHFGLNPQKMKIKALSFFRFQGERAKLQRSTQRHAQYRLNHNKVSHKSRLQTKRLKSYWSYSPGENSTSCEVRQHASNPNTKLLMQVKHIVVLRVCNGCVQRCPRMPLLRRNF